MVCMLFTNGIVPIDENRKGVNNKLERWKHTLGFRGFKLSRSKTTYLKYGFSGKEEGSEEEVTISSVAIPRGWEVV